MDEYKNLQTSRGLEIKYKFFSVFDIQDCNYQTLYHSVILRAPKVVFIFQK